MEPVSLSEAQQTELDSGEVIMFAYNPDHDGDNDGTTDPEENPDWMLDVLAGITPWPTDPQQQAKLKKVGATEQACDAAFRMRQHQLKRNGQPTYAASKDGTNDAKEAERRARREKKMSELLAVFANRLSHWLRAKGGCLMRLCSAAFCGLMRTK